MKYVYLFNELEEATNHVGGEWDGVRSLLGGKGANLAEMTRIGLPVPPGFTVTTEACITYLAEGNQFPDGMWDQELAAMRAVEELTGKKIRRSQQPAAGLLPLRFPLLHAGHDGHRSQYRPQ